MVDFSKYSSPCDVCRGSKGHQRLLPPNEIASSHGPKRSPETGLLGQFLRAKYLPDTGRWKFVRAIRSPRMTMKPARRGWVLFGRFGDWWICLQSSFRRSEQKPLRFRRRVRALCTCTAIVEEVATRWPPQSIFFCIWFHRTVNHKQNLEQM